MLDARSILVTGGTGSFGKKFVATVLKQHPEVERLVVYSRDELKQFEMAQQFSEAQYPALRYFIGDVRDKDRLTRAFEGIDIVIHAAALKQVPTCEYNPFEAIKTNILGAQNVIEACDRHGCEAGGRAQYRQGRRTDQPVRRHQALLRQAVCCRQQLSRAARHPFLVVRYGNVMGSRGSVIPFFLDGERRGPADHRRTYDPLQHHPGGRGATGALRAGDMWGGEIFVPKIPSYRITDVAEAIAPGVRERGGRDTPRRKVTKRWLLLPTALSTVESTVFRHPSLIPLWDVESSLRLRGRLCEDGFSYNSGTTLNGSRSSIGDLIGTRTPALRGDRNRRMHPLRPARIRRPDIQAVVDVLRSDC